MRPERRLVSEGAILYGIVSLLGKRGKMRQIASIKSSKNGSKPLMNYYQHFTRVLDTLDEIFRRNRLIQ